MNYRYKISWKFSQSFWRFYIWRDRTVGHVFATLYCENA